MMRSNSTFWRIGAFSSRVRLYTSQVALNSALFHPPRLLPRQLFWTVGIEAAELWRKRSSLTPSREKVPMQRSEPISFIVRIVRLHRVAHGLARRGIIGWP